jgi:hypothetical protein
MTAVHEEAATLRAEAVKLRSEFRAAVERLRAAREEIALRPFPAEPTPGRRLTFTGALQPY